MNVAGIPAEYNPFHNGHLRQITLLRQAGFDGIVAVMSGNFVQRAEPALTDKFRRAEAAVRGGVDLVLELPLPYAVASAEDFARGCVNVLRATGVVGTLCCGCESDAQTVEEQYEALKRADAAGEIAARMKNGASYPAACRDAVSAAGGVWSDGANDLLYLAYRKALERGGGTIGLLPVRRDTDHRGIGSGEAIRALIKRGENADAYLPAGSKDILRFAPTADAERIARGIMAFYRTADPKTLRGYYGFREGLEHRVVRFSDAPSLSEWFDRVKTKRFPHSAVRRAVLCGYLGVTKPLPPISYLRVLAFNDTGRRILREMKKKAALPVLSSLTAAAAKTPIGILQTRGDEIFELTLPEPGARRRDRDETARYLI